MGRYQPAPEMAIWSSISSHLQAAQARQLAGEGIDGVVVDAAGVDAEGEDLGLGGHRVAVAVVDVAARRDLVVHGEAGAGGQFRQDQPVGPLHLPLAVLEGQVQDDVALDIADQRGVIGDAVPDLGVVRVEQRREDLKIEAAGAHLVEGLVIGLGEVLGGDRLLADLRQHGIHGGVVAVLEALQVARDGGARIGRGGVAPRRRWAAAWGMGTASREGCCRPRSSGARRPPEAWRR